MARIGFVVGIVVALLVGVGIGWGVSAQTSGSSADDDAARACASAEELPATLPEDAEGGERLALLNRVVGTGLLAQAAGQDGAGLEDLDDLGDAGLRLASVVRTLDTDGYAQALDDLLEACDER